MDLNIQILGVLRIGSFELWITESMRNSWIISAVLILFALIVRIRLKHFTEIPKGFQNAIEAIVEAFDGFVRGAAGDKLAYLGNWYFMVFAFILCSNISGLFFLRPPTADWAVTFSFAFVTLILIHVTSFRYKRWAHVKSALLTPHWLFLPINIIGELARPVSLSFRLFGNILSGMILISLLYGLAPPFVLYGLPLVVHAFFDIFAGVLQTYIFCIVSLSLIGVFAGGKD
ncbi:MAG: F0F1 ATP synthase subunit A [Defluviitaleaceae bacterium]|nr:F0F1 ATP synthase subunit A [Defluviitaleaceae bacterium]MCL2836948.1 F0F1 ATP synthase subunit A [Defluviitaleaceae bacterium]